MDPGEARWRAAVGEGTAPGNVSDRPLDPKGLMADALSDQNFQISHRNIWLLQPIKHIAGHYVVLSPWLNLSFLTANMVMDNCKLTYYKGTKNVQNMGPTEALYFFKTSWRRFMRLSAVLAFQKSTIALHSYTLFRLLNSSTIHKHSFKIHKHSFKIH